LGKSPRWLLRKGQALPEGYEMDKERKGERRRYHADFNTVCAWILDAELSAHGMNV